MTMENDAVSTPKPKSKMLPVLIVVVIVVVILIGAIAFSVSREPKVITPETVVNQQPSPTTEVMTAALYKDGTYEAIGNYTSPGGAETIDVTLTLKDGVVESANVVSKATRPTSKQMQASFIGGYKEQVIGKRLDELNLTKVAKSSLAPKGFNDAVAKIKAEAKA